MIVPMKKVSLLLLSSEREKALKILRRLGVLHIEISEGQGTRLSDLEEQVVLLENGIYAVSEKAKKCSESKEISPAEALRVADRIAAWSEEEKTLRAELLQLDAEIERLSVWGEIDPAQLLAMAEQGIDLSLYEMPRPEYDKIADDPETAETLVVGRDQSVVRLIAIRRGAAPRDAQALPDAYRVKLPEISTGELRRKKQACEERLSKIGEERDGCAVYANSMKHAVSLLQKEIEFETYATGMAEETLSASADRSVDLAYFTGFVPAEDADSLKAAAQENAWGLLLEDPTPEDNAPTKLKNNKFVSLVYPLTDFLGTVPGYFEYDISAWFLGFILIFFGIIFGDGGYGLLICALAGGLILKSYITKKTIPPTYLLVLLLGGATVLWGVLTCTWFGLSPEILPTWLQNLSVPLISNVYADTIWYPFWTNGEAGLTTTQNVQIFCFLLALVQLSAAHFKAMVRNRKSLKAIGDFGAVLELIGIFYIVLALVVNGAVFGLGLVIGGVPVGTVAIGLIGVGFVMNFVFANYEGSLLESILASLKGIVSVLLGVVNVFSDIVSYIRLWAVGLAGAAISATVNELASPLLGNFMMMIFAILILVFGHGLNMILNVLSVIVHGIRLNTLEFSSHLDMSWSGHAYKPFEE